MVKPICKYSTLVKRIEDLNYELENVFISPLVEEKGRPLIEIPDDISRIGMTKKITHFIPKIKNDYKKVNYIK